MFFFGTIKSEASFLAHQYFIPLTLGITLLLLSFLLFHAWIEKRRRQYPLLLAGTLTALALSYPPALFFFIGVILTYILSMNHSLHEGFHITKERFFWYFLGVAAIITTLFIGALSFFQMLGKIMFFSGWNNIETPLSPIFFFGIVPSVLAAIGLYTVAVPKHETAKVPLYWFLCSFGLLSVFYLFDFSIFIPTPRLFVFYLIGVSILAGAGFSFLLQFGKRFLPSTRVAAFAVVLLSSPLIFHYYTTFSKPLEFQKVLTPKIHAALVFLEREYPGNGIVIADSVTSIGVYPVSGKHVVNLLNTNIGGGSTREARLFITKDCREKRSDIMDQFSFYTGTIDLTTRPFFLLSSTKQNCPVFLEALYDKGPYIYKINGYEYLHASTALSGNTLEGDDWIEYYREDGSVHGTKKSTGESYTGTWSSSGGPEFCIVYAFDKKKTSCWKVSVRNGDVRSFDIERKPVPWRDARHLSGNPYNL